MECYHLIKKIKEFAIYNTYLTQVQIMGKYIAGLINLVLNSGSTCFCFNLII